MKWRMKGRRADGGGWEEVGHLLSSLEVLEAFRVNLLNCDGWWKKPPVHDRFEVEMIHDPSS